MKKVQARQILALSFAVLLLGALPAVLAYAQDSAQKQESTQHNLVTETKTSGNALGAGAQVPHEQKQADHADQALQTVYLIPTVELKGDPEKLNSFFDENRVNFSALASQLELLLSFDAQQSQALEGAKNQAQDFNLELLNDYDGVFPVLHLKGALEDFENYFKQADWIEALVSLEQNREFTLKLFDDGFDGDKNAADNTVAGVMDAARAELLKAEVASDGEMASAADPSAAGATDESKSSKRRKKRDLYSNELIGIKDNQSYGEGKLIAVLDGGADTQSPALQTISKLQSAFFSSAQDMQAKRTRLGVSPGVWLNAKMPFAYNYFNHNTKMEGGHMHGMVVAGIIAANPPKNGINKGAIGVLPEAQLAIMRVMDDRGSTRPDVYLEALQDAIKLGVHAINMSIGQAGGSESSVPSSVRAAMRSALDKGIAIVVAAGNNGAYGRSLVPVSASMVDYGTLSTPGIAPEALTVASLETAKRVDPIIQIAGTDYKISRFRNEDRLPASGLFDTPNIEVVNVGEGRAVDYWFKSVKDKIVMINLSGYQAEKAKRAQDNGAKAVLFANNRELIDYNIDIRPSTIPFAIIPKSAADSLKRYGRATLYALANPKVESGSALINDFSSWSSTQSSAGLKPDITAPGGGIYAPVEYGSYDRLSGTSMATPHVAAASVIALDRAKELANYAKSQGGASELSAKELQELSYQLMMSTAKALRHNIKADQDFSGLSEQEKQAHPFISPRKQGSGLIDMAALRSAKVVLIGSHKRSSILLDDIKGNSISLKIGIKNYSADTQRLSYRAELSTDKMEDGKNTLTPQFEFASPSQELVLAPWESKQISLTLDISKITKPEAENGYFIDGFVVFTPQEGSQTSVLSIPFSGFRGSFNDTPIIDPFIYSYFEQNKRPTYWSKTFYGGERKAFFSHMQSEIPDGYGYKKVVLGEVLHKSEGASTYDQEESYEAARIAISPNRDGVLDQVTPVVSLLRNAKSFYGAVVDKDGRSMKRRSGYYYLSFKNLEFGEDGSGTTFPFTYARWAGTNTAGYTAPEGDYKMQLFVSPDYKTALSEQTVEVPVKVDISAPQILESSLDEQARVFTLVRASDGLGSGVKSAEIVAKAMATGSKERLVALPYEALTESDAFSKQAFTFRIPASESIDNLRFVMRDYAGNVYDKPLRESVVEGPKIDPALLAEQERLVAELDELVRSYDASVYKEADYERIKTLVREAQEQIKQASSIEQAKSHAEKLKEELKAISPKDKYLDLEIVLGSPQKIFEYNTQVPQVFTDVSAYISYDNKKEQVFPELKPQYFKMTASGAYEKLEAAPKDAGHYRLKFELNDLDTKIKNSKGQKLIASGSKELDFYIKPKRVHLRIKDALKNVSQVEDLSFLQELVSFDFKPYDDGSLDKKPELLLSPEFKAEPGVYSILIKDESYLGPNYEFSYDKGQLAVVEDAKPVPSEAELEAKRISQDVQRLRSGLESDWFEADDWAKLQLLFDQVLEDLKEPSSVEEAQELFKTFYEKLNKIKFKDIELLAQISFEDLRQEFIYNGQAPQVFSSYRLSFEYEGKVQQFNAELSPEFYAKTDQGFTKKLDKAPVDPGEYRMVFKLDKYDTGKRSDRSGQKFTVSLNKELDYTIKAAPKDPEPAVPEKPQPALPESPKPDKPVPEKPAPVEPEKPTPTVPEKPKDPDPAPVPDKPAQPQPAPSPSLNGWVYEDDSWYYYNSGTRSQGWLLYQNDWYYLDPVTKKMALGWNTINGDRYYFMPGGYAARGWLELEGLWYHFHTEDCYMQKGWLPYKNSWYYLDQNGAMQTDWIRYNNKWYYLGDDGIMQRGWILYNSSWYYLKADGDSAQGWNYISGKWYYFEPNNTHMLTGWLKDNNKWYYLKPGDGYMLTGTHYISGLRYSFNSDGSLR